MSNTVISYEGNLRSQVKHDGSGAVIVMDAPKELGGLEEGFSASDLLGVSLGGCILGIMSVAARSMDIDIPGGRRACSKRLRGRNQPRLRVRSDHNGACPSPERIGPSPYADAT